MLLSEFTKGGKICRQTISNFHCDAHRFFIILHVLWMINARINPFCLVHLQFFLPWKECKRVDALMKYELVSYNCSITLNVVFSIRSVDDADVRIGGLLLDEIIPCIFWRRRQAGSSCWTISRLCCMSDNMMVHA